MTEKTPKTPRSDQAGGPSKDQPIVPDPTRRDSTATESASLPAGKAPASTSGPTTPQRPDAASEATSSTVGRDASASETASKAARSAAEKESGLKPDVAAAKKASEKTDTAVTTEASVKSDSAAKKDPSPKPAPQTLSSAGSGSGGRNGKTPPPVSPGPSHKKPSSIPLAVVAVAVVLLAGGLWYQHATSQADIERLESQTRSSAEQARLAAQKAQQALDALNQQQGMLTALRTGLQESKAELDGLSSAFQTITDRGSDLVLLNDIDHLVMIAQQQLQLNGNVANAIISLETAQAQLARANRPTLASLQQTINGDLDRLRAATTVDIALLSTRLDELAGLVSQAPLFIPDDAAPDPDTMPDDATQSAAPSSRPAAGTDSDEWWKKALARTQQWSAHTFASLRHDLGQFISVRRVDDSAALLISPDQASRFRDSLRQRILTAQLALMMGQSLIWETETDALLKAVESRFDPQSALTRQAVKIARDVADTAIDTPLPDVTNSIKALEAMNEQMGRRSPPQQPATDQPGQAAETPSRESEPSQPESDPDTESDAGSSDIGSADGSETESGADDTINNPDAGQGTGDVTPAPENEQNSDDMSDADVVPDADNTADTRADDSVDDRGERGADDNGIDLQTDLLDDNTDGEKTDSATAGLYQTTAVIKQPGTQG